MTTGFQYICYERLSKKIKDPYSYFYEVAESIMSLRRFSNLPITIKTDFPDFFNKVPTGNLTTVKINKKFKRPLFTTHEKLYQLKDLPYDNTFLVDTETIFLDNPEKLLGSNQHIQIARETRPSDKGDLALVLLKTYNTGFIVAECNKQWQKIINQAIDIFEKIKDHKRDKVDDEGMLRQGDQWFFNKAIDSIYDTKKQIAEDRFLGVSLDFYTGVKVALDSLKDLGVNPYAKLIHLARAVDSWRIFPRVFISTYIYLLYKVVIWYMNLEGPTMEQSGLVSIVVGAGAAWFGLYTGSRAKSDKK